MERRNLLLAGLCLAMITCFSCNDSTPVSSSGTDSVNAVHDQVPGVQNVSLTIANSIKQLKEMDTFSLALSRANLIQTLSKPGPFTVFAPSNTAFKRIPATMLGELLENRKEDLVNIMSYHIVAGSLRSTDLKDGEKLKTLEGEELLVSKKDGRLLINGVNVTIADIPASNGVIHVIEAVMLPKNARL
jgi:uncharacterized surface protein with fasciclin (FAS1) repeats